MLDLTLTQVANYGLWIQTGAILVSAAGVVTTIIWHKRIACRRATLDIVLGEETDPRHVEQRTEFVKLRDQGNLAQWANPANTATENSALLRAILNRYELVAIGIQQGTMDERSYKGWCRTTLVKDWTACKPFVMQLRHNTRTPAYYSQFEVLARKWANKEERPHV